MIWLIVVLMWVAAVPFLLAVREAYEETEGEPAGIGLTVFVLVAWPFWGAWVLVSSVWDWVIEKRVARGRG